MQELCTPELKKKVLDEAPDMEWRSEESRVWKAALPVCLLLIFFLFFSVFVGSDKGVWLLGGSLTVLVLIIIRSIRHAEEIIKYGTKKVGKILDKKTASIGCSGNLQVQLENGQFIIARYRYPPPHRDKKYSDKNYAWPEVGDFVAVYYSDKKPKDAVLIWEQFNRNRLS